MLQGHAFARAVRGHLLATTALSTIILENLQLTEEEQTCIKEVMSNFLNEPPSLLSINENSHLKQVSIKDPAALDQLSDKGPTAQLWVQYFKMVCLMKEYIHAERSGDWKGHLDCVK